MCGSGIRRAQSHDNTEFEKALPEASEQLISNARQDLGLLRVYQKALAWAFCRI
jgi:hypothetical protein